MECKCSLSNRTNPIILSSTSPFRLNIRTYQQTRIWMDSFKELLTEIPTRFH
ncbi:unnamed protein product [Schistosoma margrebowiei]|uniref:Uncharacterized protein n=1 Tax=Schistosoma margrebowiei TaxID=48269 RepID=A0A183MTC3_9TREM|nr:unnamed protein product [Schistosoma margrebowiei]